MKNGILLVLLIGICACNLRLKPVIDPFYDAVLQENPANAAALYGQGQLLIREGRYKEASGYFTSMIRIVPGEARGWYGLGCCLFELHQFKPARDAFQQAVQLSPNQDHYLGLATAILMNGDIREAGELAKRIQRQFGSTAALLQLQGDIAYVSADYPNALKFYRESVKKDPMQRRVRDRIRDLEEFLASHAR